MSFLSKRFKHFYLSTFLVYLYRKLSMKKQQTTEPEPTYIKLNLLKSDTRR